MHQPAQQLQLGFKSVILSLTLLFSGTAVARSAVARIYADGAIVLRSLEAFVNLTGTAEFCSLEQRFAGV